MGSDRRNLLPIPRGVVKDFGPQESISYWAPNPDQRYYVPSYLGIVLSTPPPLIAPMPIPPFSNMEFVPPPPCFSTYFFNYSFDLEYQALRYPGIGFAGSVPSVPVQS